MNPVLALRLATGLTQSDLAERAGTSQPTIAAYEAGRKSPTLRTLERLARAAGMEANVEYHPPMTREERRSLALHEAIEDHLRKNPETVLARARATLTKMQRVAPTSQALKEWAVLLDRPLAALLPVLADPSPWARELRHVTPFAGVLSAGERSAIIQVSRAQEREAS
ncbi:MAG TPA: helix-turn-helix transcriptional regulator [Longimicrobiales bacterium]|nr:helix-turn-helix transcriptional regulator [Longimicrobiales bacterium]